MSNRAIALALEGRAESSGALRTVLNNLCLTDLIAKRIHFPNERRGRFHFVTRNGIQYL
ncbi:MAG: hypothetical protein JXR37_07660 [Kiritimatiellae bacterium]|nr:hypothetical protein [Kiritimatiellia bacterium]